MSEFRLGTCSWKYDSWKGIVYPEFGEFNYLEEYSKHYNTVEIDQWFWSLFSLDKVLLPDSRIVKDYKQQIPENFLFTIKVPNSLTLTHYYQKDNKEQLIINPHFLSADLFNEFIKSIEPLRQNIGCLIFQFEYLNKQKMPAQEEFQNRFTDFVCKLEDNTLPIGLEIRNPNYLNKNFFDFLTLSKIIPVLLVGYYMPDIQETYLKFKDYFKNRIVFRLHGPDRSEIEKLSKENWNKIYIDRQKEIIQLSRIFKELIAKEVDVFVNVNNHFEGSAPLTIKRIKELIKD